MLNNIVINTVLSFKNKVVESRETVFSDYLCKNSWQCYLVDWKNVNCNLDAIQVYNCNKQIIINEPVNLFEISELIFVRGLGNVKFQINQITNYFSCLKDKYKGVVINNPESMIYALKKHYLFYFQEKGFPVIESLYFDKETTLEIIKNQSLWKDAILKPIDGELGIDVFQLSDITENKFSVMKERTSGFILQKKMEGVLKGEKSLFFLGEEFSYAIMKTPNTNDFRVNARFSPVYREYIPSLEEVNLARAVVNSWPKKCGYFRVDLIEQEGKIFIMEVEAVNPSFYLKYLN